MTSKSGHYRFAARSLTESSRLPKPPRAVGVWVSPTAVEALKRHSKRQAQEMARADTIYQDLVFASLVGTPLSRRNLTRSFKALLKRTGLPHTARFHDLQRRTCATLLLSQDTHPKFVQELLDHATIAVTLDTYSHVMPRGWRTTPS